MVADINEIEVTRYHKIGSALMQFQGNVIRCDLRYQREAEHVTYPLLRSSQD